MAACVRREAGGGDSILEPLCFPDQHKSRSGPGRDGSSSGPGLDGASSGSAPGLEGSHLAGPLVCLFCPESVPAAQKDVLLKHLLLRHKLVIADVRLIANFTQYLSYWKGRFLEQPLEDFCSVIKTNSTGPVEKQEEYFLLCDVLPEDRVLREKLQQKRLEEVLEQQQKEREDTTFRRSCIFCSEEFTGNRAVLLNHMASEHSFSVGLPDNIVFCSCFLDTLENKLESLQCLYCEKMFRDKTTLKDHMRKKSHRRINSKNREYDKFYIINYLELGKSWEEVQSEDDRELLEDGDEDWSDWQEVPVSVVCLFCEHRSETMEQIFSHMTETHGFDLHKLRLDLNLDFYQQVKLVNFIRRQIHQSRCYSCDQMFQSREDVLQHIWTERHVMRLPDKSSWNQPQYYFPTYENDGLLCSLSDSDEDDPSHSVPVIAEDVSDLRAVRQSSVLNQLLRPRDACN